jgi:hypothetical protein
MSDNLIDYSVIQKAGSVPKPQKDYTLEAVIQGPIRRGIRAYYWMKFTKMCEEPQH